MRGGDGRRPFRQFAAQAFGMRRCANPDRSFPKLLFEFLKRGELRERRCFLSNHSSASVAEDFFATGMNDFFSRAQRGVEAAQESRGTLHFRRRLDQPGATA